jgi:hypothetical protein
MSQDGSQSGAEWLQTPDFRFPIQNIWLRGAWETGPASCKRNRYPGMDIVRAGKICSVGPGSSAGEGAGGEIQAKVTVECCQMHDEALQCLPVGH